MNEVTHTLDIEAKPEAIWDVLADLQTVAVYDPFVRTADVSDDPPGLGVTRTLRLRPMGSMRQEVSAWTPGRGIELRILKGMPVREAVAFQRISARGESAVLTMGVRFVPKRGPMGALMGRIIKRQVQAGLPRVAAGVAAMVEQPE